MTDSPDVTQVPPVEHAPEAVRERGPAGEGGEGLVEEELLVEDISIDGMCGVY